MFTTPEPQVTTPEPEVTTTEPEVTTPEPEVTTPESEVTTPESEVTTTTPNSTTLKMPKKPAYAVQFPAHTLFEDPEARKILETINFELSVDQVSEMKLLQGIKDILNTFRDTSGFTDLFAETIMMSYVREASYRTLLFDAGKLVTDTKVDCQRNQRAAEKEHRDAMKELKKKNKELTRSVMNLNNEIIEFQQREKGSGLDVSNVQTKLMHANIDLKNKDRQIDDLRKSNEKLQYDISELKKSLQNREDAATKATSDLKATNTILETCETNEEYYMERAVNLTNLLEKSRRVNSCDSPNGASEKALNICHDNLEGVLTYLSDPRTCLTRNVRYHPAYKAAMDLLKKYRPDAGKRVYSLLEKKNETSKENIFDANFENRGQNKTLGSNEEKKREAAKEKIGFSKEAAATKARNENKTASATEKRIKLERAVVSSNASCGKLFASAYLIFFISLIYVFIR